MFFGTGATRSSIQAAGSSGRRFQRVAERACRRGHDEGADASARRLLEEVQRAANIGLDEGLTRMGRDMRLVKRRDVQHGVDAPHAARDQSAVGDRAASSVNGPGLVDADRGVAPRAQAAHQRFAQMPELPVTSTAILRPPDPTPVRF